MAKQKNSGLGRGLDAIFLDNTPDNVSGRGVTMVRICDIEPRIQQPRKNFNIGALTALAASISKHGIIQPIIVRETVGGFFSIIAGERRWRAAKIANLTEIPVIVIEADEAKTAQLALIENIQRENLSPIEEANAYHLLMDSYSMTHEELANSVGKSRSAISNSLRLLELPDNIVNEVDGKNISAGHARALLGLKNPDDMQPLVQKIIDSDLSVRTTEEAVRTLNRAFESSSKAGGEDNDVFRHEPQQVNYAASLAEKLTRKLGHKVNVTDGKRAKKLVIEYSDNDDLESLVKLLTGGENILD